MKAMEKLPNSEEWDVEEACEAIEAMETANIYVLRKLGLNGLIRCLEENNIQGLSYKQPIDITYNNRV